MDELDEIIKQINDEFSEGTATTADNINRPEPKQSVKEIELFNEFNIRNPQADGGRIGFDNGGVGAQYAGPRGRYREKGTTVKNLFKEDPDLKSSIKKEYAKGKGADRIINELNLKNKVSPKGLQDYINAQLKAGVFKPRKADKIPVVKKQMGPEAKKFLQYITDTYGENPAKNVFQKINAEDIIKKSKAKITRANATRILGTLDLATKGAKLEKFYPDAESRVIELINKKVPINQMTKILEDENLIKLNRVGKAKNRSQPDYKALREYAKRLIKANKTKVKTIQKPSTINISLEAQNLRDEKILEVLDKQNDVVSSNKIAKIVSKEIGENISSNYVENFFKRNNLNIDDYIKNQQKRIFPEIQALDKIVKLNLNFLTNPDILFTEKGKFIAEEYTKAVGKTKAQTITSTEPGLRLVKLLSLYAGDEQRFEKELYSKIKPLKNYNNQIIQKNLISLAQNLHRASNIDVARMLGLPKKDIKLLTDLSKAVGQLGDFKMAGDHTDIKAIMRDFPGFKKNFLRIEFIKNELNQLKSYYDKKVIALYGQAKAGANPVNIKEELSKLQNEFANKTGYRLGGFDFNEKGKIIIDPKTPLITQKRYPINDNLLDTMNNIEGFKFKTEFKNPFDKDIIKTTSPKERLSVYEKYKNNAKVLNDSKYIKAVESIPKFRNFKKALIYGGAGAGAVIASVANAEDLPSGTTVDSTKTAGLTTGEKIAGGTAAAGAYKFRKPIIKGAKAVGRGALKLLAPLTVPIESAFVLSDLKSGSSVPESLADVVLAGGIFRERDKRKFIEDKYGTETLNRYVAAKTPGITDVMDMPTALPKLSKELQAIDAEGDAYLDQLRLQRAQEFERKSNLPRPEINPFQAAGGGIAKLAGDRSGAMLESMNSDKDGLQGILNRVKKT